MTEQNEKKETDGGLANTCLDSGRVIRLAIGLVLALFVLISLEFRGNIIAETHPLPDLSEYALIIGEHDSRPHEGAGSYGLGQLIVKSETMGMASVSGRGEGQGETIVANSTEELRSCLKNSKAFCYAKRTLMPYDADDMTVKGYENILNKNPSTPPLWITTGHNDKITVAYVLVEGTPTVRIESSAFPPEGITAYLHDRGIPVYHISGNGGQEDATPAQKGLFYGFTMLFNALI